MKANRAVDCGKSRECHPDIVFDRATNRGGKPKSHRPCHVVALALALQSLLLYGALPARAQSQKPAGEVKRPALQIGSALRFNEDWSSLEGVDTSKTDDFWDRLKFIPFTADQSVWLSIGGQARARFEHFDNFQFGASAPKRSDTYLLSRFRLNTDLHITPYFRVYVEGKSSLSTDRDLQGRNSTAFYDQADLFNGFADVVIPFSKDAGVTLRGGRQELLFGSQRLVGPGDFTQVPHTFDGAQAIVRIADWTVIPFWTQAVIVDKYKFDKSSPDRQLYGLYTTAPAHLLPMNLDLYYLGANTQTAAFNSTADEKIGILLDCARGARSLRRIGILTWKEPASSARWAREISALACSRPCSATLFPSRSGRPGPTSSSTMRAGKETRRRRRHLQSALSERPFVSWLYRLHRAAEHHHSERWYCHKPHTRSYAHAPAILVLARLRS